MAGAFTRQLPLAPNHFRLAFFFSVCPSVSVVDAVLSDMVLEWVLDLLEGGFCDISLPLGVW
jgi:hypothetical protein